MRWLWWLRRRDAELDEELASHFRLAVEDRVARGATRAQAESAARREFGNELLVREATRRQWSFFWLERVLAELALSLRALRRSPRFFIAAVLCIALGTGVTVTILTALQAVLLRPLPYADADRLMVMQAQRARRETRFAELTQAELDTWRRARAVQSVGTWRGWESDVSGPEDLPERVAVAEATRNLFTILGVRPRLGHVPDAVTDDVVILSDALWRRRYGADPEIVGRTIEFENEPHRVAAIMPPRFSFPEGTQLWTLLPDDPGIPRDILFYGGAIARLAVGRTEAEARAELDVLARQLQASDDGYAQTSYALISMREHLLGALRRPVLIFQSAALLVLLVACANVGALQLARSAARRRELALRAAIGADRRALALHVFAESVMLALIGGAAGTALAFAGTRMLALAFPDGVPSYIQLHIDVPVLIGALTVSLAAAVLFGATPAWQAGRTRALTTLDGSTRSSDAGSRTRTRFRYGLVTGEIAVTVVLAAGAVLLVRSDVALRRELGFTPDGVLSARVPLSYSRYREPERRLAFYRTLEDRLRALPGVESVTYSFNAAPLDGPVAGLFGYRFADEPAPAPGHRLSVQHVGADYAQTLGVRLRAGRDLQRGDGSGTEWSALANHTFARQHGGAAAVVGRVLSLESEGGEPSPPIRIVGVIADVRHERPPAELLPTLYVRHQSFSASRVFLLRTRARDAASLGSAVRSAVYEIDPAGVASRIQTQEHVVRRAFWRERLQRNVVTIFASCALLLAVFGMYGVISYAVAQRTAELGIRVAMGASTRQLLMLVLREAAGVAVAGIALGCIAALALTRVLSSALHGVRATDPLTLTCVAVALLAVAITAAIAPARRAARLDPVQAIASP